MKIVDPILPGDLDAYVDDQLDVARRIEVEAYLSEHPESAAQVMADLRIRGELRLALANGEATSTGRHDTREAARRLSQRLSTGRYITAFQRIAAIAALVTAGWFGNAYLGPFSATEVVASVPPPAFVEEALRAHSTTMLRESMPSQHEVVNYDPADIRSATAIVMPELPKDWDVFDIQVFPSAFGPSVELVVTPDKGERLSLFAVRPGSFNVQHVLQAEDGGLSAAYWQIGDVAYALVSDKQGAKDLTETARRLSRTLY
ncbi:anti-sigma factor RsiW [Pararhizobium capsulatum DSM 1112]|uniref:Anti-sigma factor RsiW n=1 Tax=Pararhizobium capsulatum DSM 1112 TaxID=1121113 RepID=A0ABU0BXX9_9HYPH|nr:anti-sigma factor [Pararhizobium capsulatum]MDQ0322569.1 anti-sigma factor RsiW [Pararhizobium capsulatum DSM 1112]